MDNKEFLEVMQINSYIQECKKVVEQNDNTFAYKTVKKMCGIFVGVIPGFKDELDYYNVTKEYTGEQKDYLGDLEIIIGKLNFFMSTFGKYSDVNKGGTNINTSIKNDSSINNSGNSTNNNSNVNTNTINATLDIKSEIDRIREEIEADEVLGEEDKAEINEKLDEVEKVMGESNGNNEKWKKLKSVISWSTTKGYKIGKMIMPLIIKTLFPEE